MDSTNIKGSPVRLTYYWESQREQELKELGAVPPSAIALSHRVLQLLSSQQILAVLDGRAMLIGEVK